jgi:hypothetical protein
MPADLEYVAMRLFGDWSAANVGNAVMGVFSRINRDRGCKCG